MSIPKMRKVAFRRGTALLWCLELPWSPIGVLFFVGGFGEFAYEWPVITRQKTKQRGFSCEVVNLFFSCTFRSYLDLAGGNISLGASLVCLSASVSRLLSCAIQLHSLTINAEACYVALFSWHGHQLLLWNCRGVVTPFCAISCLSLFSELMLPMNRGSWSQAENPPFISIDLWFTMDFPWIKTMI